MFCDIGDHCDETVRDEALLAGVFPLLLIQSIPDCQQQEAEEHQRVPLAETVTEIAEQNQPGVGSRTDRWIEGTDEPSQRHIPPKQSHEHEEKRTDGEEHGCSRRES